MIRLRLMAALLLAAVGCKQAVIATAHPIPEATMSPTPFLPAGFAGLPTGEVALTRPETAAATLSRQTVVADGEESPTVGLESPDLSAIYETINRLRERQGVPDLVVSPDLAGVAQDRAEELSRSRALWHIGTSSGATPGERMAQAGFSGALSEHVIAVNQEVADPVGTVLQAWLTDASHRRDVLDPQFALTGLGLSADGRWLYLVQLLAEVGPGSG